ncbi:MAG: ABC transporter substrate-binding protein [Peptococcaceae bacterium]|jgi:ABC-type transport system substrate-binding protein|nr:ABC transporter substrate-binding protein [Peptococcaceae bacterium]
MSKRIVVIISTFLLLTVLLSSCGGQTGPAGAGSENTGSESPGTTASSGSAAAGPERSRTVRLGTSYKPTTMDPNDLRNWSSTVHAFFTFETLIYTEHTASGYKPQLAKSWEITEDGKSWIFQLRDDVDFSNGDHFTADDVVYTVERVVSEADRLVYKSYYAPTMTDAEKIDEYTVKINFSEPFPDAGGAFVALFIINSKAHQEMGDDLFHNQLLYGTGPWILDEWVDGQFSKFHKNPNYWNKAGFDPYFDNVELNFIAEPSSAIAAHLSGTLDSYSANGGISMDMVSLYDGSEDRIELVEYETCTVYDMGLSFKEGSPWLDDKLREAFDICIDRQMIIDTIFGGTGASMPVGSLHKYMTGYDETLGTPEYDPDRARQLVAESTYDGRPIEFLIHPQIVQGEEVALALADMAIAVGINMVVKSEEFAVYTTRQNAGDYDIFLLSVSSGDGNPFRSLEQIIQNYNKPDVQNWPGHEELYALIEETMGEKGMDPARRAEYAKRINKFIFENRMPRIRLVYRNVVQAQNWGIAGIDYWPDGMLRYASVNWDPSKAK